MEVVGNEATVPSTGTGFEDIFLTGTPVERDISDPLAGMKGVAVMLNPDFDDSTLSPL